MPARRRDATDLILAGAAGVLLAGLIVSAWRLAHVHSAVVGAQSELLDCLDLARQIVKQRERPAFLTDQPTSESSVTAQIHLAVQTAQIPPENVIAIDPLPPRAVGESGLRRQTVTVDFANLTLPQLARFLDAVRQADPAWINSHLGLSAGGSRERTASAGETWSVQVALTRHNYSPITRDIP